MLFKRALAAINRSRLWQRDVDVWDLLMAAPSLDRWLYLQLHRIGLMGRDEKNFLRQVLAPGMRIADVGANVGLYALFMARWAGPNGKVFAFEPDAAMGDALRRNVRANCPRNVEVFLHAVGSRSETGVLHGSAFNSGDSRLHVTRFPITGCHPRPESDLVQSVPIRTLDQSLPGQRLDLIKIDVQGWEAHVLRGIVTLFELNPGLILYFEFWPAGLRAAGSSAAELKQLLADRKLRVYRPGGAVTTASIDLEEEERKMKPNGYVNLLARQA